jgi:hypothetical protein
MTRFLKSTKTLSEKRKLIFKYIINSISWDGYDIQEPKTNKDNCIEFKEIIKSDTEKNNYCDLERNTPNLDYTFKNCLDIVNKNFDCNFKKLVLSEILSTEETNNITP